MDNLYAGGMLLDSIGRTFNFASKEFDIPEVWQLAGGLCGAEGIP